MIIIAIHRHIHAIHKSSNHLKDLVTHSSHINQGTFQLGFSISPLMSALKTLEAQMFWFENIHQEKLIEVTKTQKIAKNITWHSKNCVS